MKTIKQTKYANLARFKRPRFIGLALVGLAIAIALTVLAAGGLMGRESGSPLPDFTVDTFQGKYSLSGQKGKTLVYFFAFPG